MMIRLTSLALALAVSGCSDIVGFEEPLEYPDAVEYSIGPEFRGWWMGLQACSGLSGRLTDIDFFYVPRESLPSALHGIRTVGAYYPSSNRIFVVQSAKLDREVIRHEMMHALLRNESGHPPKYFGADGVCGYL